MYRGGIHGNYDITVIYEEIVKISNIYMYKVQKSHPRRQAGEGSTIAKPTNIRRCTPEFTASITIPYFRNNHLH
jgi:hypothetical protein